MKIAPGVLIERPYCTADATLDRQEGWNAVVHYINSHTTGLYLLHPYNSRNSNDLFFSLD